MRRSQLDLDVMSYIVAISACGKRQSAEAGLGIVAGVIALPAGAERNELQLGDQRLRKGAEVGEDLELAAGDAALPAGGESVQLQRGHQRLREGRAVGAGLELGDRERRSRLGQDVISF